MAESYDEQTREIITHCSGRVLGIHSDDDLVGKYNATVSCYVSC